MSHEHHRASTRRQFLGRAGMTVAGLTLVPRCEFNEVNLRSGVGGLVDFPFVLPVNPNDEPIVSDSTFHFRQFGGRGIIENWSPPNVSQEAWTLTIDGFVGNPLTLRFSDIQAASTDSFTFVKTLRCVIDTPTFPGLVGNAIYRGVPLRRFLDEARVDVARTARFYITGADSFSNNILRDEVLGDFSQSDLLEPLLVYEMNGEPLHPLHGAPVRLLVPGKFGYKNVKSVVRIEAGEDSDDVERQGTYQTAGFVDDGNLPPTNKVTNPISQQVLSAGPSTIFGFALSGAAGIERVDLSIDEGDFAPAEFIPRDDLLTQIPELAETRQFLEADRFPYPFRDVWTLFRFDWEATPGPHIIVGRATDRAGNVQPPVDDGGLIDGANGQFRVEFSVEG